MRVMGTLNPYILTRSHKKEAMMAINLIKENGAENLKGGRTQMDDHRDATKPKKTDTSQPFTWKICSPASSSMYIKEETWNF